MQVIKIDVGPPWEGSKEKLAWYRWRASRLKYTHNFRYTDPVEYSLEIILHQAGFNARSSTQLRRV